jgi:hypothetical protein
VGLRPGSELDFLRQGRFWVRSSPAHCAGLTIRGAGLKRIGKGVVVEGSEQRRLADRIVTFGVYGLIGYKVLKRGLVEV